MSDIFGDGYGHSHDWARGFTGRDKCTPYTCRACGLKFYHFYDVTPGIFAAIQKQGNIDDQCAEATSLNRGGKRGT
jgi:hypothetical protein